MTVVDQVARQRRRCRLTGVEVIGQRRYPLGPLVDAAQAGSVLALAEAVGFTSRTVHRWAHTGIADSYADEAAVALGLHPGLVWPEWWSR